VHRIDTKSQRTKLLPRGEPYWHKLSKGFYVGFRLTKTGSETWVARQWMSGRYQFLALDFASDFDSAKRLAEDWRDRIIGGVVAKAPTVAEVCRRYVESLVLTRPKTADDSEGRFRRLVYESPIGLLRLDVLQAAHIRLWMNNQIDRGAEGDNLRKAKASANRNLASLKAALEMAFSDRLVTDTHAWASVKPFSGVSTGRCNDAFVERSLRSKYLEAASADLSNLIKACLLTGARPGELEKLEARDYNRTLGTLTIRQGKQQRPREVALTAEATQFFNKLSVDVIGAARLLRCSDGTAWNKDKWKVAIRRLCRTNDLPHLKLYDLRHTAISEMLMAGMDTFSVAKYTGTSVQMIERTYGHLKVDSYREVMERAVFV